MLDFLLRFVVRKAFFALFLVAYLIGFANAQTTQPSASPLAVPAPAQPSPTAIAPKTDSPTNTVQEFYKAMRERRFRDALMMTNLRPAVEKLTQPELANLSPDFEPMATRVPEKIELSGEQISGSLASVFVKANDSLTNEMKVDEIKLRRENNAWTILTGDAGTEAEVKRSGANYFFKLRLDTRHADVESALQDIIKAQFVYSLQHKMAYADFQTLINEKLLSAEATNPDIMGYRFRVQLSSDKKKYTVNAEPVEYGKTGKLSFLLLSGDAKSGPKVQQEDKNGAALSLKN